VQKINSNIGVLTFNIIFDSLTQYYLKIESNLCDHLFSKNAYDSCLSKMSEFMEALWILENVGGSLIKTSSEIHLWQK